MPRKKKKEVEWTEEKVWGFLHRKYTLSYDKRMDRFRLQKWMGKSRRHKVHTIWLPREKNDLWRKIQKEINSGHSSGRWGICLICKQLRPLEFHHIWYHDPTAVRHKLDLGVYVCRECHKSLTWGEKFDIIEGLKERFKNELRESAEVLNHSNFLDLSSEQFEMIKECVIHVLQEVGTKINQERLTRKVAELSPIKNHKILRDVLKKLVELRVINCKREGKKKMYYLPDRS